MYAKYRDKAGTPAQQAAYAASLEKNNQLNAERKEIASRTTGPGVIAVVHMELRHEHLVESMARVGGGPAARARGATRQGLVIPEDGAWARELLPGASIQSIRVPKCKGKPPGHGESYQRRVTSAWFICL